MKITIPPEAWAHFWEEPPSDTMEFWGLRWPIKARLGDPIFFFYNKQLVAEAKVARIEGPGQSECDTTGRFRQSWKVFWTQESFTDRRGNNVHVSTAEYV